MRENEKESTLKKNAILNTIKQVCTIVFPMISFAYSTRILGRTNIGIYSFSQSIVSYFSLIAGLGISTYAIREGAELKDDQEKFTTFANQVFSINLISTLFSYLLLLIILHFTERLKPYTTNILIQSTVIFLATIGTDWINSAYEDYKYLTFRYIGIQIISLILLFWFVKNREDIIIYTIITVFATAGGNLLNLFYVRKYTKIKPVRKTNFKKHFLPILVLFSNTVAVQVYVQSDITMLGMYLNMDSVGIYSTAVKIYSLVKQLINALIVVTVPRFSYLLSHNDKSTYNKLGNRVINTLVMLLLPSIMGLWFEGENIICLFAGEEYISGFGSMRLLCIALSFAVGGCFFASSVLIPNKREKKFLIATISAAAINIVLNLVFIPLLGIRGAAITTIIAEIINCVVCIYFSKDLFVCHINKKELFATVIGTVFVGVVCYISNILFQSRYLQLFCSVISSVLVYGGVHYLMNHKEFKSFLHI